MKKTQSSVTQAVNNIGRRAVAKLEDNYIPLYPKYYAETFLELIDSASIDIQEATRNNPELLFCKAKEEYLFQETFEHMTKYLKFTENMQDKITQIIDKYSNHKDNNEIRTLCFDIAQEMRHLNDVLTSNKDYVTLLEKKINLQPITKLYNQAVLEHDLTEIFKFGLEKQLQCHIIMLNIDDFDKINKEFSRIAGDKALIFLANLLQSTLRKDTKVYHLDADEFCILLNRKNDQEASFTAQRILNEIKDSQVFFKGRQIRFTCSASLVVHQIADTATKMIQRAKEALNEAKQNGKACLKEVL